MVSVTLHGAPSQHQCRHNENGPLCTRTVQSELLTFLIKDTKYIVTMAQVANNGEIQPRLLPDLPSFLLGRSTHGIINWIRWSLDGEDLRRKCTRRILPAVWDLLEMRIREHPNEAREVDRYGCLLIHRVFHRPLDQEQSNAAPVSLVELLIELHIEGLHVQDNVGSVPLHYALYHPHMRTWTAFVQSFATAM
jgi:hypothetical protein